LGYSLNPPPTLTGLPLDPTTPPPLLSTSHIRQTQVPAPAPPPTPSPPFNAFFSIAPDGEIGGTGSGDLDDDMNGSPRLNENGNGYDDGCSYRENFNPYDSQEDEDDEDDDGEGNDDENEKQDEGNGNENENAGVASNHHFQTQPQHQIEENENENGITRGSVPTALKPYLSPHLSLIEPCFRSKRKEQDLKIIVMEKVSGVRELPVLSFKPN